MRSSRDVAQPVSARLEFARSDCKASAPESRSNSHHAAAGGGMPHAARVLICKVYQHKDTENEETFVKFHMYRLPETMRKGKCHLKGRELVCREASEPRV